MLTRASIVLLSMSLWGQAPLEGQPAQDDVLSAAVSDGTAFPDEPFLDLEWNLTRHTRDRYSADLDEIKRRGVLRVLTRNNSSSYFVARGAERGFEFELARAFAHKLGVRLAIVVPNRREDLIHQLLAGAGDLVAAGMTRTRARAEKVRFTRPLLDAPRVVATHRHVVKLIERPEDLMSLTIHTNFRSTTFRTASRFQAEHELDLRLVDVKDGVEMEQQLDRVANGTYEATIVDTNVLDLARAAGIDVVAKLPIGPALPKAWAVHPDARELHAAADAFVREGRSNRLVRIMYVRYYRPHSTGFRSAQDAFRADTHGIISPYDDLFKKAAAESGVDWRLLAAVAFVESKFDPHARSPWGATGLMQVLPSTARRVGVSNPFTPWGSIRAGARYLRRLIDFFADDGVAKRQQVRFALAAYNAGLGHVQDARGLSTLIDRNPDRWFHNVEDALLLKTDRKWHERTRHGYARAGETLAYVSRVQAQYDVFARHVASDLEDSSGDEEGGGP
ncbi:MAG: transglycosylase SLT domain-containing protein [Myxococcota bacterium]